MPIDRPNPVLQFLEAQTVADFAVRPNDSESDLSARQFIVQPPKHPRSGDIHVRSVRKVEHHAFQLRFTPSAASTVSKTWSTLK